jgi:hypothetical protein
MSLYQLQKVLYEINRDPTVKDRFFADRASLLGCYKLTDEEREAIESRDIGKLYIMGVNGQILMHFAALCGFEWEAYIQAMKDGLRKYGNVRAGLYAAVDTGRGGAI